MNDHGELSLPISEMRVLITNQLKSLGYSQKSIYTYSKALDFIAELQDKEDSVMYSSAAGNVWIEDLTRRNCSPSHIRHCRCMVLRLNDILEGNPYVKKHKSTSFNLPTEYEYEFNGYINHIKLKCNSRKSIHIRALYASEFFNNLSFIGCHSVTDITGEDIVKVSVMNNTTLYPWVMRSVLKYLLELGVIHCDYSALTRKVRKPQPIPTVYTKDEIWKIEQSPNLTKHTGKRDRAMILLASRNGLRAGNIAGLKLTSIDFDNEIMHLEQVKTGEPINPVLLSDVKTAIVDYIENGRPPIDSDFVFLTNVAPYTPMHPGDVYNIISKAIQKSEIDINGRKRGPHALRASLNSAGVNNGITYEEMRVINGHKNPNAIKHYARLDDLRLRECALDVCDPTGFFSRFLNGKEILPTL